MNEEGDEINIEKKIHRSRSATNTNTRSRSRETRGTYLDRNM